MLATFNAQTDTLTEFVRAGGETLARIESDGGDLLLLIIIQLTKIQSMVTFANIIGRIKILLKNIVVTGLLFVCVSCIAEDNTYLEHVNFEVVIQNENLSLDSYLEFIAEDNYPTVGFGSSVSGWLSMCDIPQLLALVESEKSVKAAYSMVSAQLIMDRSTLAQESVFLLLGLKVDRYPPVMTASMIEEDERDDVIAWAKSEASRNTCGEAEIQK
ncbi:hypothetical protein [Saccharophagus degradans]|uniref:Uncharacterized protein n=1 Tax=Saccharophagus degradans TaxID=86304 RepID=A0AAW7XAQ2_9GAMM|nr:hypothetical protein [Saccharophagus degradans]MDO6424742.1 hypothetical protein [Saccharophagus degradans]MDO6609506.1 hypothetical protein [Saccharophagus degradans]